MNKVIVFAGTTEGREICSFLKKYEIASLACTATEYGKCRIEEGGALTVRSGRLTEEEMEQLFGEEQPEMVIDATHPYADLVSENIRSACEKAGKTYLRLLRPSLAADPSCVMVDTTEEAVSYLAGTEGKILVTTGSKELAKFAELPDYKNRVYARVLPLPGVIASCAELGFDAAHTIGMQGPFSMDMNVAMLQSFHAEWMVTKESGRNGGFEEKIEAAKKAGVRVVLIGRPKEEEGLSEDEVKRYLVEKFDLSVKRDVVIAGIGPGAEAQMTLALVDACEQADVLIGAGRMTKAVEKYQKPMLAEYSPEKIYEYLKAHPEYEKIVLLQSGDVGFYSGAKKLKEALADYPLRFICGISSGVYFASKLQTSWDDMLLTSMHGRSLNLLDALKKSGKVFTLASDAKSIRELADFLLEYGRTDLIMSVGTNLSYPEESIMTGVPADFSAYSVEGVSVVLLQQKNHTEPVVTHGIPDAAFIRAKVPMTKEEVRSISLSKLQLQADSVVYDVGAGTGSISIEAACMADRGIVYAIEQKEEAVALIRENSRKFGVSNLQVIHGKAPDAFVDLETPTHAFLGGTGGNMREIIGWLRERNPQIRIVINCIALETLAEITALLQEWEICDVDIASVNIGKAKQLGAYHLMMGQNPVYVISFGGKV